MAWQKILVKQQNSTLQPHCTQDPTPHPFPRTLNPEDSPPYCWAGASIFYILHSTLILPSSGEGSSCWGCCCCWLLRERTRSVIITWWKVHGIYSNNLVRTDHICSCLVTIAAREWIDQSHDDRYPVYWLTAYQHNTGWSYHRLLLVTGIHCADCEESEVRRTHNTVWTALDNVFKSHLHLNGVPALLRTLFRHISGQRTSYCSRNSVPIAVSSPLVQILTPEAISERIITSNTLLISLINSLA